jgi:glycolate oxidase iron-sulfur subunit
MQTSFTAEQLNDPVIADANGILRKCVHCGFCTATCPTYQLLGDELDSPRGRIYLIKGMLERGEAPTKDTVKHIDRCLSCLSCMTTCPSGVNYMHLVDGARTHIEKHYKRPFLDRIMRRVLAEVMPSTARFHGAIKLASLAKPLEHVFRALGLKPFAAMLALAPKSLPAQDGHAGIHPAQGERRGRVALLTGCVQPVLQPEINAASIRVLNRAGIEVVVPEAQGCCGSIDHHMGREETALVRARRNIDLWDSADIDAVIINTSGCGTVVKDYGHMLRLDPAYAEKAARVAAKTRDITEYLLEMAGIRGDTKNLRVAYHSACSMQHGQQIKLQPKKLLQAAGFEVVDVPEGHLCCGSAGTYNILQSEIADRLKARKVANIEATKPDVIATGNIGCIMQIAGGTAIPIVHTIELLDWAGGGPKPAALGA